MTDASVLITVHCHMCGEPQRLPMIRHDQLKAWVHGVKIQEAMPELDLTQRELLISGTCGQCFDRLFPPEAEIDD